VEYAAKGWRIAFAEDAKNGYVTNAIFIMDVADYARRALENLSKLWLAMTNHVWSSFR